MAGNLEDMSTSYISIVNMYEFKVWSYSNEDANQVAPSQVGVSGPEKSSFNDTVIYLHRNILTSQR
jgi:hypothetical protein